MIFFLHQASSWSFCPLGSVVKGDVEAMGGGGGVIWRGGDFGVCSRLETPRAIAERSSTTVRTEPIEVLDVRSGEGGVSTFARGEENAATREAEVVTGQGTEWTLLAIVADSHIVFFGKQSGAALRTGEAS